MNNKGGREMKKIMAILMTGALLLTGCGGSFPSGIVPGTENLPGDSAGAENDVTEDVAEIVSDQPEIDTLQDASSPEEPLLLPEAAEALPEGEWQVEAAFPDRRGKIDDTLAMNSIAGFNFYSGQGKLYVSVSEGVTSFDLYVNDRKADTSRAAAGGIYEVDFSEAAKNGRNTVMVSSIEPLELAEAVKVYVPYPEVREGTPEEAGIRQEALDAISGIISSDIEYGFTSAQLAVIKNGVLVYENSWGKTNSYLPDGTVKTDSPEVTNDTLYDLASVTKMFSVNYILQKLVTEGKLSPDEKVISFLGNDFADLTLDFEYDPEKVNGAEPSPGIETQKKWKESLTIRDLLRHQGGFPPGPRYNNPYVDARTQEYGEGNENILFAGNDATKETREETIRSVCKTPLLYEPGTKTIYSDVDYLILGLIAEQITGKDLDTYLKETFFRPMGLSHITYNPLQNGFEKEDCAATELVGNTRDGYMSYPGIRTETIQGEVHDDMAYYSMGGVSGHAGLFSNAADLAKLASVMLTGGWGNHRFFSGNSIDTFTSPKKEDAANWGLGWWREGDDQRSWYFGSQASSRVFGHQGWTGTLVMIDPENDLVVAYLTNKINSPITDKEKDPNKFNGGWYTSSTLGFVPQILTIGMDGSGPVDDQIFSLLAEMTKDSIKLAEEKAPNSDHPLYKSTESKLSLLTKMAEESGKEENRELALQIQSLWDDKKP